MKLGHIALDGTKIEANASKHKAMSYGSMEKEESMLRQEIEELLRRAEQTDKEEDRKYGTTRRGDELPEELGRRESRLQKIQKAIKALEQEAITKDSDNIRNSDADNDKPKCGRKPSEPSGLPKDSTRLHEKQLYDKLCISLRTKRIPFFPLVTVLPKENCL